MVSKEIELRKPPQTNPLGKSGSFSSRTASDLENECLAQMASNGIPFEGPLKITGKIERFSRDHKKRECDEWYIAFEGISSFGTPYLNVVYGSWSDGVTIKYCSYLNDSPPEELQEMKERSDEARRQAQKEIAEEHDRRELEAQKIWHRSSETPQEAAVRSNSLWQAEDYTSYLKAKKVQALGIRFEDNPNGYPAIVIPLQNVDGQIRSLQYISMSKDGKSYKTFLTGGEKKGNFFIIGNIKENSSIYVCEGYATGASVHEATGEPVVISFDSGSLDPVVANLRKRWNNPITIAGDNDVENENNPGRRKGEEVASKCGCKVVFPQFDVAARTSTGKRPTDFNDLHVLCGIEEVRRQLAPTQEIWETPTPLPEGLPPVAHFGPDMLPHALRAWIIDIAERMQIPPDFSAAASIVVLSSLLGRKLGIHPKEKDDWLVVPNLWGAIIGRPSLMKSPAISEIMKPLNRFAMEAKSKYEEDLSRYERELMAETAQKECLKEKYKKAAMAIDAEKKLKELIDKPPEIVVPTHPTEKRYKTEDGTTEKIGELLVENPNGLLIHRDELTGWFKNLDKDGREGDRAFYLESWNGSGSFTVDRIKRGTLHIPALCLSILGGIQPGPLSSYVYQATKGGSGDDGLLQRFQLTVWPDAPRDWVNIDRWPDSEAKNRAYGIFRKFDSYEHPLNAEDVGTDIPFVRFSSEAQVVFNKWRENLEKRIRKGDLSGPMESHLAKYRSLMPSLALIFQLCHDLDDNRETHQVDQQSAEMAILWCQYLETHAYRLYSSAEKPELESARMMISKIANGDLKDRFTLRESYRSEWSKLTTLEEAKNAAEYLINYGWLKTEEVQTGGRPKKIYRIHPDLNLGKGTKKV